MAVRFRRQGTTDIKDHNDLLNRGTRTHDEIDTYLDEIDAARGTNTDLDKRFDQIEAKNIAQDTRLTAIETKNTAQETRLTAIETKNSSQDTEISNLKTDITAIKTTNTDQDTKIKDLTDRVKVIEDDDSAGTEVIAARTDSLGNTYPSLKARLDAGGTGGGGGPIGNYLFEVYKCTTDGIDTVTLGTGLFVPGIKELEVFRGGTRLNLGEDYLEVNNKTVKLLMPLYKDEIIVFRVRDRLGSVIPVHIDQEYFIVDSASTTFFLSNGVTRVSEYAEIFYNGQLQSVDEDYTLVGKTLTFNFEPVIGSLILIQIVDKYKTHTPKLLEESIIADSSKSTYTLSTFDYKVGTHQLELYVNGKKQQEGIDYDEIDSVSFRFLYQLKDDFKILAVRENGLTQMEYSELVGLRNRVTQLESDISAIQAWINTQP